jgi:hypothetical protein
MTFVKEIMVAELDARDSRKRRDTMMNVYLLTGHTLFRKKLPEMLISSHLTTIIFWPERICLEIMEASRPRRCPFPSITMGVEEKVAIGRV